MNPELISSQGSVQGSKEALVTDIKRVVGDADALLKGVANSTMQEIATVRTKLGTRLVNAKSRIGEVSVAVSGKAKVAADATGAYVGDHPWKALGVTAVAGVLLGFFMRRR